MGRPAARSPRVRAADSPPGREIRRSRRSTPARLIEESAAILPQSVTSLTSTTCSNSVLVSVLMTM